MGEKSQDDIATKKLPRYRRSWTERFIIIGAIVSALFVLGLLIYTYVCVCGRC